MGNETIKALFYGFMYKDERKQTSVQLNGSWKITHNVKIGRGARAAETFMLVREYRK